MVHSMKDLKLMFNAQEREKIKGLLIKLMEVETQLAYKSEVLPLDVFLNYIDVLGSLLRLYSAQMVKEKGISYLTLINRLTELKRFADDFSTKKDYDLIMCGEYLTEILEAFGSILEGLKVEDLKKVD